MPNVNAPGSSPPPVSGSVEDPQQIHRTETVSSSRTFPEDTSDLGLPQQQSVLDHVEVLEVNQIPEQLNTGEEKASGDDEQTCSQSRSREEVIKEISISSTAFIGPAFRPQPAVEDELSEFYKELAEIDQPDTVDRNNEHVSQACAPPDTANGNSERKSQSWAPTDTVDGNSKRVSQSRAPSRNPPAIKEKGTDHRYSYKPYPAVWPQTDYRNTPQWRPQSHDMNWSDPYSYQNQWQLPPPPNIPFYPPPRHGNPTPPPYSQPQGQQYSQLENSGFWLSPDVRFTSSPSPASFAPYEAFERQQYEEQNYQDGNQHENSNGSSLVLILMRGVPGSGKSTLAR